MTSLEPATILIVDDELQNRRLLEALLRSEGYATISVSSGKEALAAVATQAPDLILLDIMMPGMDGYQVARILKGNGASAHIPIIMVTAMVDSDARLAGLNAGAEEFLTKPVERAELWLRVRNLLRLKAYGDFLQHHGEILERQVQARTADLQRFRTAMDASGDAILLVNRATMRFIEVNDAVCNLLGYTRAELAGMGPDQIGAVSREELERVYDKIIAGDAMGELGETHLRRKDGSLLLVEARRQAKRIGEEWVIVGVLRDITARKEAESRLHHLAHYDSLTGLPNRTLFNQTLKKTIAQATESGWQVAVMCLDVDNFKNVNDMLGHAIGDELLGQFGIRLVHCLRIRDTVGRLGGDEFAIILVLQNGQQDAAHVANNIRAALRKPFDLKGHEVVVSVSIGISVYPEDAADPITLMKYADTAMYRAKQAGRDTFRFFTPEMNTEVTARLELETALRKAVENEEFVLHYQPKVDLRSRRIVGYEALLRWERPGHGLVPPRDFIPALEETGLIVRVGTWVIGAACRQMAHWARHAIGPVQVSVNVSGRQFIDGDLEADVSHSLAENEIPADLLELELTESCLMANTERTIACLRRLKEQGVRISIDDFGTGYSSLAYLQRFPIDKVKIDIAFVRDVTSNPDNAAIVLAIIRMAHSLKLATIAEGVETPAQLAYLRRHGCDEMQGYYFSPPLPAVQAERLLVEGKSLPAEEGETRKRLKTLLVVDDEPRVLTALQQVLRKDGYQILTAASAEEGFELLALHPIDVLLCDERMPTMSGTAFLDRVASLYPETFRIVLSGQADPGGIMEAINRGAIHRFYTKPWDNRQLRDNMRDAFRYQGLSHDAAAARSSARERLEAVEADGHAGAADALAGSPAAATVSAA